MNELFRAWITSKAVAIKFGKGDFKNGASKSRCE